MARIPTAEIVVNGRRKIVNADDPRVKHGQEAVEEEGREEEMTRSDVARMKRADLVAALEAHGVPEARTRGVPVPKLREQLTRIMFVDV